MNAAPFIADQLLNLRRLLLSYVPGCTPSRDVEEAVKVVKSEDNLIAKIIVQFPHGKAIVDKVLERLQQRLTIDHRTADILTVINDLRAAKPDFVLCERGLDKLAELCGPQPHGTLAAAVHDEVVAFVASDMQAIADHIFKQVFVLRGSKFSGK